MTLQCPFSCVLGTSQLSIEDLENLQMYVFEEDYDLENIVRGAREDFRKLINTQPVDALNNQDWKTKIANHSVCRFNAKSH